MSGDKTVKFPGGKDGKLPEMTADERRLWLASHRAPENMLLVTDGEMTALRLSFDACVREVTDWRRIGRMYMGADLPEGFEPALRAYMAVKEQLEKDAKSAAEAKVPSTVRPVEP